MEVGGGGQKPHVNSCPVYGTTFSKEEVGHNWLSRIAGCLGGSGDPLRSSVSRKESREESEGGPADCTALLCSGDLPDRNPGTSFLKFNPFSQGRCKDWVKAHSL